MANSARGFKPKWYGLPRTCRVCGVNAVPMFRRKYGSITCSKECARAEKQQKRLQQGQVLGLPTGTIGAIGELVVAADLLLKGYAVFRALSPSCPCDLALLCEDQLYRVEVTTGHRTTDGKLLYPPKKPNAYEVLAVVVGRDIYYQGLPSKITEVVNEVG